MTPSLTNLDPVSKKRRLLGVMLDVIIINFIQGIVVGFLTGIIGNSGHISNTSLSVLGIALGAFNIFLYFFILETLTGQTIGKKITKTMIVDENGQKPTAVKILIREIVRFIPLEAILIFFDSRSRTLHDLASKTQVVKTS